MIRVRYAAFCDSFTRVGFEGLMLGWNEEGDDELVDHRMMTLTFAMDMEMDVDIDMHLGWRGMGSLPQSIALSNTQPERLKSAYCYFPYLREAECYMSDDPFPALSTSTLIPISSLEEQEEKSHDGASPKLIPNTSAIPTFDPTPPSGIMTPTLYVEMRRAGRTQRGGWSRRLRHRLLESWRRVLGFNGQDRVVR